MSKKIKRKPTGPPMVDPKLEEVGEDRAFEIELDEETNEIIFVYHYRRKWGDDMDGDVEHGLNMEEAMEMVNVMITMIDETKKRLLVEKATPIPIEGNPMQGPQNIEGK
jgi:hypothetical protein